MGSQKMMGADMLKHFDTPESNIAISRDIFSRQKEFCAKFVDFDQVKRFSYERKRWVQEFHICISDEVCEVLNWLPWKHWKNYDKFELNEIEIRFELIDILHFVVDLLLLFESDGCVYRIPYPRGYEGEPDSAAARSKIGLTVEEDALINPNSFMYVHDGIDHKEMKKWVYEMLETLGEAMQDPLNPSEQIKLMYQLNKGFMIAGMGPAEVYDYYRSKHAENEDRQKRNY